MNLGQCHICGEMGKLTFEHIPPRKAMNNKPICIYDGNALLSKNITYLNSQRGNGKFSLCEKCNNITGSWYAESYIEAANNITSWLESNTLPNDQEVYLEFSDFNALAFTKQVIAMFCSLIPYECVHSLGMDALLLDKEDNAIDSSRFDIRMFITPMKNAFFTTGKQSYLFADGSKADLVIMSVKPFAFILNLNPEIEMNLGYSLKAFLNESYEILDKVKIPLRLLANENGGIPRWIKPI